MDRLIKIVVVDDDERILRTVVAILEMSLEGGKMEVLAFTDPMVAWMQIQASSEKIDLLISDYYMSGMNGDELIKKVNEYDPLTKTVLLSGGCFNKDILHDINLDNFFRKPIDVKTFMEEVQLLVT